MQNKFRQLLIILILIGSALFLFVSAFRPTSLADLPYEERVLPIIVEGTNLSKVAAFADGCGLPQSICNTTSELYSEYVGMTIYDDMTVRAFVGTVLNFNSAPNGTLGTTSCEPKPLAGDPVSPVVHGLHIKIVLRSYLNPSADMACYLDVAKSETDD